MKHAIVLFAALIVAAVALSTQDSEAQEVAVWPPNTEFAQTVFSPPTTGSPSVASTTTISDSFVAVAETLPSPTTTQPPETTRSVVRSQYPTEDQWYRLRMCESTDNLRAISPQGWYRGLYQFDLKTWASVGGVGDPIDASREEQDLRARLLYDARGRNPWPVCGRYL